VGGDTGHVAWCRSLLQQPRDCLDPAPLVTGDDLLRHGVAAGPIFAVLLKEVRRAQLDGEIHTRQQAIDLVDRLVQRTKDEG
jgi:poly(A) polymerase